MVNTEILGIEVDETKRETWVPVGAKYYLLLKKWWDHFGLCGNGLMIGAQNSIWKTSHNKLKEIYPKINNIYSVDFAEDADIIWDITMKPKDFGIKILPLQIEWIVCQATLEHIDDPMGAMRNLSDTLLHKGLLYLHTCGPACEEHKYPVDCYRFMRDSLIAFSGKLNLKIEDLLWTPKYCYAVYRKM